MKYTLVEQLEFWRADSPDEWTMDEFIREAKILEKDKLRMDYLESMVLNVRTPLPHGSKDLFWSYTTSDDDEMYKTGIREQIDAILMLKLQ